MDESLSNFDIFNILDGKANIMTYNELTDYENLWDAMGKYKSVIILYESKFNYGHWVCVFERPDGNLEFFNSYGGLPDDSLKKIDSYFRIILNQQIPHLTRLLYLTKRKIEYNDYQLQEYNGDIRTCGKWVCARLLMRNININYFIEIFKKNIYYKPDELVTLLIP